MLRDGIALFIRMNMFPMTRQINRGISRHKPPDVVFEHNPNDAANGLGRQTNS
jgi:hypothetical protein